jgi:putative FmdB family regulatory protein
MPIYDYKCKCGETRTVTLSISVTDYKAMCICGEEMRRVFVAPPVIFKGNGFYSKDK